MILKNCLFRSIPPLEVIGWIIGTKPTKETALNHPKQCSTIEKMGIYVACLIPRVITMGVVAVVAVVVVVQWRK